MAASYFYRFHHPVAKMCLASSLASNKCPVIFTVSKKIKSTKTARELNPPNEITF
jgi:hypothetical protein